MDRIEIAEGRAHHQDGRRVFRKLILEPYGRPVGAGGDDRGSAGAVGNVGRKDHRIDGAGFEPKGAGLYGVGVALGAAQAAGIG